MKNAFLLIVFLFSFKGVSQQNDTKAALYNIGLGSVFGGIGAMINKKPQEKYNKVFIKGLYQGALGGAVIFGSKKMVYNFHKDENIKMLWSAKLINALGTSIIENASSNRDFWERWHVNIGFNRIEIDTKGKFRFNYKIMPVAFAGSVHSATKGKFNLKYSLQTLTPIFITEDLHRAITYVNSIVVEESRGIKHSLAHEFIHTLQYDDYMNINMFFNKKRYQMKLKSKFIDKWSKWVYMDLPSGISLRSLYLIENINKNCYYDNFFEAEANFYSNKNICR